MNSFCQVLEKNPKHDEVKIIAWILESIAICQNRIERDIDTCERLFGRSENDKIQGTPLMVSSINKNRAVIARLKKYYNYRLTKLNKYTV